MPLSSPTTPAPSLRTSAGYFIRLLSMSREHLPRIAGGVSLGLVINAIGLITPYLTKLYIDRVYPTRDISLLRVLIVGVFVIAIATTVLGSTRAYYSALIVSRLGCATSLMFFNHLQHLPLVFFEEHRVGEIMTRFQAVREALNLISSLAQLFIVNAAFVLLVPPLLLLLNWKLALLSLLSVPLTAAISATAGRFTRQFWKASAEATASVGATQVEVLSNIRSMKALGAESAVFHRVRQEMVESLRFQLKAMLMANAVSMLNGLIAAVSAGLFTWFAWNFILRGELTIGGYLAFMAYVGFLVGPAAQAANFFANFQQTSITLGRMFEYLDVTPEQSPGDLAQRTRSVAPPERGDIVFHDVSLAYVAGRNALTSVSLTLHDGTITAIVGPSGAGKSSLLKLLGRYVAPTHGAISVSGRPIGNIPIDVLRRHIGVIWQDTGLLMGSIRDNLSLGLEGLEDQQLYNALETAQLSDLVHGLPDGIDTEISEWGSSLSGGQRQRLGVARALLHDYPVTLFDEIASQIDSVTEEAMMSALQRSLAGRTVVFVTHRLPAAILADQVCMMDQGRVVALGRHDDLIEASDVYRRLVQPGMYIDPPPRLRVGGKQH